MLWALLCKIKFSLNKTRTIPKELRRIVVIFSAWSILGCSPTPGGTQVAVCCPSFRLPVSSNFYLAVVYFSHFWFAHNIAWICDFNNFGTLLRMMSQPLEMVLANQPCLKLPHSWASRSIPILSIQLFPLAQLYRCHFYLGSLHNFNHSLSLFTPESDITKSEQNHLADLVTTPTTHCPPRKLQTNWITRNYRYDSSAVQNSGEIWNYKLGWAVDLARLPLFWKPLGQCTALHLPIYTTLRSTFASYVIKSPRVQFNIQ